MEQKKKMPSWKKTVLILLAVYYGCVMLAYFAYTVLSERKLIIQHAKYTEEQLERFLFSHNISSHNVTGGMDNHTRKANDKQSVLNLQYLGKDIKPLEEIHKEVNLPNVPKTPFNGRERNVQMETQPVSPIPTLVNISAKDNFTANELSRPREVNNKSWDDPEANGEIPKAIGHLKVVPPMKASPRRKARPKHKLPPKPKPIEDPKVVQQREAMARDKVIAAYLRGHEVRCLSDWSNRTLPPGMKPLCNCTPSTLLGYLPVDAHPVPLNVTLERNKDVLPGGHWEPATCTARYRIAIIIPFRDRHEHLSVLLDHLHPKLRGQQHNYTIIVVEQNQPEIFNKASLMNVGFKYAQDVHRPDCVIFHDVDMIPEDGRHFYTCRENPLHLGAHHTRHKYRVIYSHIFGGVTSFRAATFEKINGFSNRFFGWGGEDDDMSARVRESRLRILRTPRAMSGYTALVHKRDKGNIQRNRSGMVKKAYYDRDTKYDGLNSLRFVFHKRRLLPLYTWLLVDVMNDETKIGFDLNSG